ncbi:hypothetical protein CS542_01155 [Pedobacter sp. IW39]|nr:hypothetical protein CS542_01155 [Pedobacter sp. IW39]
MQTEYNLESSIEDMETDLKLMTNLNQMQILNWLWILQKNKHQLDKAVYMPTCWIQPVLTVRI